MAKLKKQTRINREVKRIKDIYAELGIEVTEMLDGIIARAAYMRVSLEDYEKDIDEKGYVELFSQSEKQEPYERERPVARLYNTMAKNYMQIMRQLADLLPKNDNKDIDDDGFDRFIQRRE